MRTRLTLKAGRPGTRRLMSEYGERLVCVRFRYDEARKVRLKTVELIVEEKAWDPGNATAPGDPLDYVLVRVNWSEEDLRRAVKRLGGQWNPEARAWRLTWAAAKLLNLTVRIIRSPSTGDDPKPITNR